MSSDRGPEDLAARVARLERKVAAFEDFFRALGTGEKQGGEPPAAGHWVTRGRWSFQVQEGDDPEAIGAAIQAAIDAADGKLPFPQAPDQDATA